MKTKYKEMENSKKYYIQSKKSLMTLVIGKIKNPWKTFQALLDVRLASKKEWLNMNKRQLNFRLWKINLFEVQNLPQLIKMRPSQ